MSTDEKAALAGRLFIERNDALGEKVALDAELRSFESVLSHLDSRLKYLTPEAAELDLDKAKKFLNVDAIVELLRGRIKADKAVELATGELRKLGVEPR